jgi:hypothetical protein
VPLLFRKSKEFFFIILFVPFVVLSQSYKSPVFIKAPDSLKSSDRAIIDTTILTGPKLITTLPEQDSAYLRAKRLAIPPSARFYADMKMLESQVLAEKKLYGLSESEIAKRNLQVPAEFYIPSPQEQTLYQYNIMQSQYVPFVRTYNPFGVKVPLSAIGGLLGLAEDVSPLIEYELDVTIQVKVVIYSPKALIVATIVDAVQPPGKYKYYWNGRDDVGKLMPKGDYIGEIRIGNSKVIRKRIRIE